MENHTENVHKEVEELCLLFGVKYDAYFLKRALREIVAKQRAVFASVSPKKEDTAIRVAPEVMARTLADALGADIIASVAPKDEDSPDGGSLNGRSRLGASQNTDTGGEIGRAQHTCHDMNPPFPGPCAACEIESAAFAPVSPKDELDWRTCGIIELAVRNPNVASYIEHWEGRALKAEAALARMEATNQRKAVGK